MEREREEMEKEGGNGERIGECRESISCHFLLISSFSLHFLILFSFPHSLSISSQFPHFLSISSSFPHSLFISSQPGCKAATIRAALGLSKVFWALKKKLKVLGNLYVGFITLYCMIAPLKIPREKKHFWRSPLPRKPRDRYVLAVIILCTFGCLFNYQGSHRLR